MTPLERTVDWLCKSLTGMPSDIKMVYIDSGEHVTLAPDNKTVASYDLFGFSSIPAGGFDPENDEHVGDLGCWDWEANPNCEFPDVPFEAYNWLEVLESAAGHPSVAQLMQHRTVLLLFADHDGPITVVR